MEVARRWWWALVSWLGALLEEVCFRLVLAFDVLAGRKPQRVERRWWNRATEPPILISVFDWTDERRLFSCLVWPALEVPPETAADAQEERVKQVMRILHAGAAEMAWSTRYEVDYGLKWDPDREVWTASDGFAYAYVEERALARGGGVS